MNRVMMWVVAGLLFAAGGMAGAAEKPAVERILTESDALWKMLWAMTPKRQAPTCTPITSADLKTLPGTWEGIGNCFGEPTKVTLKIQADGSWTSSFRPHVKRGYWYLRTGKIQLWEDDASRGGMPETFLYLCGKELRLFTVDEPRCYVPLARTGSLSISRATAKMGVSSQELLVHLPLTQDIADASRNRVPVTIKEVTIRNGAAWFAGKGSYLILPHQPLSDRPFAIAMWVKLEGDSPTCGLLEQRAANKSNQHLHLMIRGGHPYMGFYVNDLRADSSLKPAGGWTHLVFQFTGREQEIWVNDKCVASRRAKAFAGTTGDFVIGKSPRWSNVPSADFQGAMRHIRIYGRALSPVEIDSLTRDRR